MTGRGGEGSAHGGLLPARGEDRWVWIATLWRVGSVTSWLPGA